MTQTLTIDIQNKQYVIIYRVSLIKKEILLNHVITIERYY